MVFDNEKPFEVILEVDEERIKFFVVPGWDTGKSESEFSIFLFGTEIGIIRHRHTCDSTWEWIYCTFQHLDANKIGLLISSYYN